MTALIVVTALSLSFLFMFLNHPLSFGLVLLVETFIISMLTGMMNYNYWFSYILFLIMVGGMLILFMYMTSIASNEKFFFSMKLTSIMLMSLISMISVITVDSMITEMNLINQDLTMNQFMYSSSLTKYTNYPSNMISMMIISYLLITLIVVVKITKVNYGPMRQKF